MTRCPGHCRRCAEAAAVDWVYIAIIVLGAGMLLVGAVS